jgi:NAD(P)H-dependent flavin oxidoreductase YrpB (nitropropane dioxygenase family)
MSQFTENGFDNRITRLFGIQYPIVQAGNDMGIGLAPGIGSE